MSLGYTVDKLNAVHTKALIVSCPQFKVNNYDLEALTFFLAMYLKRTKDTIHFIFRKKMFILTVNMATVQNIFLNMIQDISLLI